jgi:hypothetical protein
MKIKRQKKVKPITIGSVVQLKSGGSLMTVVSAVSNPNPILTVIWEADDSRLAKSEIPIQALRLVR